MPRARKPPPWLKQCCYHVSNTCYNPARIFRFANMRQRAVDRLREIKQRYAVRFLDYLLHPDGYRLLVEADHPGHLSDALRSFHAGTTYDYCSRKEWDGPVWRPRASITLVERGSTALRCALDMDFQMVRTGDTDLFHPLLWKHTGHHELCEIRKRYRVIDRNAVRRCLMDVPWEAFREWYIEASTTRWNTGEFAEEPWWHAALAVASRELCETIADTLPERSFQLKVHPALKTVKGLQGHMAWTVATARRRKTEYIRRLIPKPRSRRPA